MRPCCTRIREYKVANFIFPEPGSNVSNHFRIRKGDVEAAWPECATIIERNYRIRTSSMCPLSRTWRWRGLQKRERLPCGACSQSPFAQRYLIANALGFSQSDVQVVAPYVAVDSAARPG